MTLSELIRTVCGDRDAIIEESLGRVDLWVDSACVEPINARWRDCVPMGVLVVVHSMGALQQ
jgi:predicted dinucleotide-utilizing enzyme